MSFVLGVEMFATGSAIKMSAGFLGNCGAIAAGMDILERQLTNVFPARMDVHFVL
jgi:hypothetical protein